MSREYSLIIRDRILSLCHDDRISISDLARISGVNQKTLNSIIHGQSANPKIKTLHKIANAFRLTPAEFLDIPEINDYVFTDSSEDKEDNDDTVL